MYTTLLGTAHVGVADFEACLAYIKNSKNPRPTGVVGMLPTNVLFALGLYSDKCRMMDDFGHVFYRDGSALERYERRELQRNEFDLDRKTQQLFPGDEHEIAAVLTEIHHIASRNDRKNAIIIPPVYETLRHSAVDEIATRAIQLAPNVTVIDHRHLRDDRSLFVHYDHQNQKYFELLIRELREKKLLSD